MSKASRTPRKSFEDTEERTGILDAWGEALGRCIVDTQDEAPRRGTKGNDERWSGDAMRRCNDKIP